MVGLIESLSLPVVVIVLLVAIPSIVNFIKWCKGIWKTREDFRQQNITQGRQIEAAEEREENRFSDGERRIGELEKQVVDLKTLVAQQAQLIKLLVKSDELDIKSWIKMQHEKWMAKKYIDSQSLDLLEQRYAIYKEEGGNSWALRLMNDLRSLPVVTIMPISEIHEEK